MTKARSAIAAWSLPALMAGLSAAPAAEIDLSVDRLCDLAHTAQRLHAVYHEDPDDSEIRVFDIYGMGRTIGGNPAIFGLQQGGYSRSASRGDAPLPDWRTLRLDRLKSLDATGETFDAYPPSRSDADGMGSWMCVNDVMASGFG